MNQSCFNNIGKIFDVTINGDKKRFMFSQDGKTCWLSYRVFNKQIIKNVNTEEWMYIGGENSTGFIDCDFKGCDFSNFDITCTQFINCKFDYGVFDYSFTSYEGMINCIFG